MAALSKADYEKFVDRGYPQTLAVPMKSITRACNRIAGGAEIHQACREEGFNGDTLYRRAAMDPEVRSLFDQAKRTKQERLDDLRMSTADKLEGNVGELAVKGTEDMKGDERVDATELKNFAGVLKILKPQQPQALVNVDVSRGGEVTAEALRKALDETLVDVTPSKVEDEEPAWLK